MSVVLSLAAFGQPSLTIPSVAVSGPNNRAFAKGELTLGAPGYYIFTYAPNPPKIVSSVLTTFAVAKPFSYNPNAKPTFEISAFLSGCAQETLTLTFRTVTSQTVLQQPVTFKCFPGKAALSFPNALKGSGTPQDPARYCGAAGPVRISGSGSSTASTYDIEVRDLKENVTKGRTLTVAEAASIANFDLQKVVPQSFFKGGRSYAVTLTTNPPGGTVTKTIAFDAATPRFLMTDRNGKVFEGGIDVNQPVVICPGKMLLNADVTACESSYFIAVEESDANWTALGTHGWSRWFDFQQAPDGIDLDALIAANPKVLNAGNKTFTLTPREVNVIKSVPRYFRVGFATGEPAWDVRWLFVRTGTPDECSTRIVPPVLTSNECPRTDIVPWGAIGNELKRLIFAPCTFSRVLCINQSERQRVPLVTPGTNQSLVTAWQGPLGTGGVDIARQDQIVAAVRARAAEIAPVCPTTGEKKVPVDFEFELGYDKDIYRVHMRVWYACCGKLF